MTSGRKGGSPRPRPRRYTLQTALYRDTRTPRPGEPWVVRGHRPRTPSRDREGPRTSQDAAFLPVWTWTDSCDENYRSFQLYRPLDVVSRVGRRSPAGELGGTWCRPPPHPPTPPFSTPSPDPRVGVGPTATRGPVRHSRGQGCGRPTGRFRDAGDVPPKSLLHRLRQFPPRPRVGLDPQVVPEYPRVTAPSANGVSGGCGEGRCRVVLRGQRTPT